VGVCVWAVQTTNNHQQVQQQWPADSKCISAPHRTLSFAGANPKTASGDWETSQHRLPTMPNVACASR